MVNAAKDDFLKSVIGVFIAFNMSKQVTNLWQSSVGQTPSRLVVNGLRTHLL
jgi:hypothetical protein